MIIAARRSAIGRAGGMFASLDVEDLAAPVMQATLADANVTPDQIDDVLLGNAAGPGGNIARLSALHAGFPSHVPGVTVDRQCGSGLEAVMMACHLIMAGAGTTYLAGGVESQSRAPLRTLPASGTLPEHSYNRARFAPDAIGDPPAVFRLAALALGFLAMFGIGWLGATGFLLLDEGLELGLGAGEEEPVLPFMVEGRILPEDIPGKESRSYRQPVGVIALISH